MSQPASPRHDHGARRSALRACLGPLGATHLLVTAPADVRYLTGFAGSNGQVLLAAAPAGDRLITDERYLDRAALEAPGVTIVASRDPGGVAVAAAADAGGDLAVDAAAVTWEAAQRWTTRAADVGVDLVAAASPVAGDREVKDHAEIAALRDACRITTEALSELLDERVHAGATERDLAVWLERRFVDLGADAPAFDTIIASGPNAAVPHHAPTDRPIVAGDAVTVDCGARVDGYHADCTRTVAVDHLDDELTAVHALVERAQLAGRAAAVAGALAGDVDAACRDLVAGAGYGDRFVHGTGHGVGLVIHEAPAVARGSGATLRAGTAMTVEPGVYLPGRGGVRIEDTIVVTADGDPLVLTDLPRTLRLL